MELTILIPAHNEEENIKKIVEEILKLNLGASVLIIDDNSQDKTGEIADSISKKYQEVKVIHRKGGKKGLGAAYIEGLKYVLSLGAEKVITMDADFSHNPRDIPRLLKESEKYDVVVGSRYVSGGGTAHWEWWRKLLSWGGINISQILLGLKIKDCTAGFKCYNRKFLESVNLNRISSQGYAFQVEMILQAQNQGFSISEIPIIFKGREKGESKVNLKEILRFAQNVLKLALQSRFKRNNQGNIYSNEFQERNKNYYRHTEDYDWVEVTEKIKGLETFFHRARLKEIEALIKQFGKGQSYLDAGCGTGLILRHLPNRPVGLDINPRHLKKAKKYAPRARLVEGDIESMSFPDNSFSTIICTEVLEHIPNPQKSLSEIKRVLQPGGVLIGSVPKRFWVWKLRFLSSTCPRKEPFHKEYDQKELSELLSSYFEIIKLSLAVWGMSFTFVCKK